MTDLYARLGIDFDQLGCVMLDCEPPTFLHDLVPPTFWYRDPARPGEYGPEMQAHVTLLFGLIQNANTIRAEVDEVLEGWRAPEFFEASKRAPLEMFGGPDAPYDCIVLRPSYDLGYSDAHRRLSRLPHINTFPDYQAHVTVGYVIKGAGKYLLPDLERALSERRTPLQLAHTGLNYGRAEGEPYA